MPKWDDVADSIFDVVFHNEANCVKKSAFLMLRMNYILLNPDK